MLYGKLKSHKIQAAEYGAFRQDLRCALKGGDRRVRIFSAHNNWWATPEVSLPLPYQRSAKVL